MQVDTEGRGVLRGTAGANSLLVPGLVDHAFDGDAKALEPGFQITGGAMGCGVNPDPTTPLHQGFHERFGATTEGLVVTPAAPPGDILLGRYGRRTDQGIIDIERDAHKDRASQEAELGPITRICCQVPNIFSISIGFITSNQISKHNMNKITLIQGDCLEEIERLDGNSVHAVCTDPPYGLVEFSSEEVAKLRAGQGGIWRLPPKWDGCERRPLPRFTVLSQEQKKGIEVFFSQWARVLIPKLRPGGHVLIAGNPMLQMYVQKAMVRAGFENRETILRLYHGFRGGDRPKNAEGEFSEVCVTPRGNYEPWMLFRKPISEKTVAENLPKWGTGGLRKKQGTDHVLFWFGKLTHLLKTLPIKRGPSPISLPIKRGPSPISRLRQSTVPVLPFVT